MEKSKKIFTFALVLLAGMITANASAISFQVVQEDSTQSKIRGSSYKIEDELMNYFFNSGYIVTNSQTVIAEDSEDKKQAYKKAFNEAVDGQCDFIITVNVLYKNESSLSPELILLSNIKDIEWEIVDINTGKKIAHGKEKTNIVNPENDTELGIATFTDEIAKKINEVLNNYNAGRK